MEIRHAVVLLAQLVSAREWVQIRPSGLLWMWKRYRAFGSSYGTMAPRPSVSAHPPSILVWMCNGYRHVAEVLALRVLTRELEQNAPSWLVCLWPFRCHYWYWPVSECALSAKTSVNVEWKYGMFSYCSHKGNWPGSECRTVRPD